MKIKLTDLKVPLFAFDWRFVVIFLCLHDIKCLSHSSFFYFPSSKYILLWPSSLDTEEFLTFSLPISHYLLPKFMLFTFLCLSLLDFIDQKEETGPLFHHVYCNKVSRTSNKSSTTAFHHQSRKEGDTFYFSYSLSYIVQSPFLSSKSKFSHTVSCLECRISLLQCG